MSNIQQKIDEILTNNKVVLFMKGSASAPMCGFSARAASVLQACNVDFATVDVLRDEEIRQGIKDYGNWPTIPQLYINKKLVGGSDIVLEMYESGELQELLTQN